NCALTHLLLKRHQRCCLYPLSFSERHYVSGRSLWQHISLFEELIFYLLYLSNPTPISSFYSSSTSLPNRVFGLALLLPLIPAIAWVLYNIFQPALNQINRMRNDKGVIIGLGLGGLTASSGFLSPQDAMASEIAAIAEAGSSDNRGQLLLFVVAPAILWVLYNILQPALNQINRMRSD
ncbi:photosystem II core complex proteins psbY, chloroplastic-like, partial [Trifolium pratense]